MAVSEELAPWVEAGLYDPEVGDAQLEEVLAYYTSVGIRAADFVGTPAEELVGTVNMSQLRPGATLSAEDVQQAVGIDAATFERIRLAAGYAADQRFTPDDVAAFESFTLAQGMFTDDALEDFARVLSWAMAKVADATSALFRIDVAPRIEAHGGAEIDYARQNHDSALMIDGLMAAMRAFFRNQMVGAVRLSDQARQNSVSDAISTVQVAVGFVDIVGYTERSAATTPDELARFIVDFERAATTAVHVHGGRLVKLIGDEIMFVAAGATDAVRIALAIGDAFRSSAAQPRGGVAVGEVIGLGGDYYGNVVNLASRMVGHAVPGEILVDASVVEACGGDVDFDPAGRRELKGFAEPVPLWTVVGGP